MQESEMKTQMRSSTKIFFLLGLLGGSIASLFFLILLSSKTNHEKIFSIVGNTFLIPTARADVPESSANSSNSADFDSLGTASTASTASTSTTGESVDSIG